MTQTTAPIAQQTPSPAAQSSPVIVLGDYTMDLFVYDCPDSKAQGDSSSDQPLLTREAWQYARGYEARYCLSGTAALEAMLRANNISVIGNPPDGKLQFADAKSVGSLFILTKRPNIDDKGKTETRTYLSTPDLSLSSGPSPKMVQREYTWRVDQGYLSRPDKKYTNPLNLPLREISNSKVVCLFDNDRGFHTSLFSATGGLSPFSEALANLPADAVLVIRTPDPTRFAKLFPENGPVKCRTVFICPLDEIANDSLRTSGTWSDVWRNAYDHLGEIDYLCTDKSSDWCHDIILPVYQDGALWFGPNQWSVDCEEDKTITHAAQGHQRSTGRLFMSPGAQPRLMEFAEPGLIIGTNLLITYAILKELASVGGSNDFRSAIARGIERGLVRMRQFHNRGYCELWELTPTQVPWSAEDVYIFQPKELWHDLFVERTDLLLKPQIVDPAGKTFGEESSSQLGEGYEVKVRSTRVS